MFGHYIYYVYDKNGKLKNQVTKGNWEVTNYYGFDEKNQTIFYQSVENGSINRDVYRIGLNGKNKVRLSSKTGTNNATFSPNFQYFITTFSSATKPTTYTLNDAKNGKEIHVAHDLSIPVPLQILREKLQKKAFSVIGDKGKQLWNSLEEIEDLSAMDIGQIIVS